MSIEFPLTKPKSNPLGRPESIPGKGTFRAAGDTLGAALPALRIVIASALIAAVAVNAVLSWQAGQATGTMLFAVVGLLAGGLLIHTQRSLESSRTRLRYAHAAAEAARAEAEAAQQLSSFQLAAIVESSEDAIVSQSLDGTITSWNPGAERLFGYTAEEVQGQPLSTLIPPDRPDELPEIIQKLQRGERVRSLETIRMRKDGEEIAVSMSISPTRDAAGRMAGAATITRDMSERKRAENKIKKLNEDLERRAAELTTANQELEAFSYSVSHDLRAPLRAMDGFSRILLEEHSTQLAPEAQRYVQVVRDNASQMGQLVDDLLRFSRLSRQALKRETVSPGEVAKRAIGDMRLDEEAPHVQISVGDLPPCEADAALLKQVYANLIGNAVKFTGRRETPMVEVGWREEEGECVYFVRDNGAGFDARYAHKLFGVFQRLHKAEEYEGTGVGLAIVQRVIHRHGGRIWAESELNKGAMFSFTIGGGLE